MGYYAKILDPMVTEKHSMCIACVPTDTAGGLSAVIRREADREVVGICV